ncbi:Poly(ethylene terephthalate) hydrolase [Flavobacterium longum]|uniref:poly(ethylene terephthalate) hydrolase family protein n=1 Tax=Flavobacterium longum TaxID=1299340 RepID=UPI0039EB7C72
MPKNTFQGLRRLPMVFLLFCVQSTIAQPFAIGHQSITFNDSARNRNIAVELYYPADVAGDNVAIASGTDQFPVIAFGHGFVMGVDAYDYLKDLIVPEGFIFVLPKTEGGILPSHLEFGKDLAFCIEKIKALGQDGSSFLNGSVAGTSAVMGHSMGGGAAFLAAGLNSQITALATLAPAETSPSAVAAAGSLAIPSLVFAGANDCVTPPPNHQIPMYDALQSACKTYISITGGSHCQMADNNFLCSVGEASCSPDPEISRETQHAVIAGYVLDWLKRQLSADCEAGAAFDAQILIDPAITYQKNCTQCAPLGLTSAENDIQVFPNPVNDALQVIIPLGNSLLVLYDAQGRKVLEQTVSSQTAIDVSTLSQGCYWYVLSADALVKRGMLVKN